MSDITDQIAQIKANSTKFVNTAIRQVQGGFVVTGQVQYQDTTTKGIVLSENAEGVASDVASAVAMTGNYLNTGSFDAPAAK